MKDPISPGVDIGAGFSVWLGFSDDDTEKTTRLWREYMNARTALINHLEGQRLTPIVAKTTGNAASGN